MAIIKAGEKRNQVFAKTENECFVCGVGLYHGKSFSYLDEYKILHNNIYYTQYDRDASVDHFIPRDLQGSNNIDNLFPICRKCNSKKGKSTLFTLIDKLPIFLSTNKFSNFVERFNFIFHYGVKAKLITQELSFYLILIDTEIEKHIINIKSQKDKIGVIK